jgi:hypothetical protein
MSDHSKAYQPTCFLGVHVGGDWTVHDFTLFFAAIDRICAAADLAGRAATDSDISISVIRRRKLNAPRVASVTYASPGLINLDGLGEPLEVIRRVIKDILGGHFLELKAQSVEIAIKEEELRHRKEMNKFEELHASLSVADEYSSLMRASGQSEEKIQGMIQRGFLEPAFDLHRLYEQQKLTGVGEVDFSPSS